MCLNWVYECFGRCLEFCRFLHFLNLSVNSFGFALFKLIWLLHVTNWERNWEEGCSYLLLCRLLRGDGRWQSLSACICTFPYLLYVAFSFTFLLHAVCSYYSSVDLGWATWMQVGLNAGLIITNLITWKGRSTVIQWKCGLFMNSILENPRHSYI